MSHNSAAGFWQRYYACFTEIHTYNRHKCVPLLAESATNHSWLYISGDEPIHLPFHRHFGMTLHFAGEDLAKIKMGLKMAVEIKRGSD